MRFNLSTRTWNLCLYLILISLLFIEFSLCSHAKIAFTTKREGETAFHIYVMEDNGSNLRRITPAVSWDRTPRWFPDGKRILFVRDYSRGKGNVLNTEFFIIDETGFNERRFMINHPTDKRPVISPDGKQIAFNSNRSGNWDIYTLNLESGNLKQLTDNDFPSAWSYRMDWSPDGKQIAYQHDGEDDSTWNIWIMDTDGNRKRRLTPNPDNGMMLRRGRPVWSPSGRQIMYTEHTYILNEKRVFMPNTTQLIFHNLNTGFRSIHDFPKFTGIAFLSWMENDHNVLLSMNDNKIDPASNYDIYKYNIASRKLTNLTNHPNNDYHPHWIEGYHAVSPQDKLTTQWGQLKETN